MVNIDSMLIKKPDSMLHQVCFAWFITDHNCVAGICARKVVAELTSQSEHAVLERGVAL